MKTIYVKDVFRKVPGSGSVIWKKAVPTFLFLGAMFLLGRAAGEVIGDMRQTSAAAALESENWGLEIGRAHV